jgi:prepilin-type N-terminal cleavage/methylation domain-containing protein
MRRQTNIAGGSSGFTLVELLVATSIFAFIMTGVSSLFISALNLERQAAGIQKINENAQYVIELISREMRVSTIDTSKMGDTNCNPLDDTSTKLFINHPVNGSVGYSYQKDVNGYGGIYRNGQRITTTDVDFKTFAFCVSGSGTDGQQTRLTMPMTIQAVGANSAKVTIQLQTTVVSRDLTTDLAK